MPHRIVRQLLNNEKVIRELSESWPMKRAAKFAVTGFYHATHKLEGIGLASKFARFRRLLGEEYKKAIEQKK